MTANEQLRAALQISLIMADAIRDSGPHGIPSGHLYAALMSKVGLDAYNSILGILKKKGWVVESGHLLTWTGPAKEPPPAPAPVDPLASFGLARDASGYAVSAHDPSAVKSPAPGAAGGGIVVNKLPRRRARKAK